MMFESGRCGGYFTDGNLEDRELRRRSLVDYPAAGVDTIPVVKISKASLSRRTDWVRAYLPDVLQDHRCGCDCFER